MRGTIEPVEPWIIVNTTTFDGMSTLVRVRVDSTDLQVIGASSEPVSTHYKGSILVRPAGEASIYTITIALDVLSDAVVSSSGLNSPSRQAASQGGAFEDDEGDIVANGNVMMAQLTNAQAGQLYQNAQHRVK